MKIALYRVCQLRNNLFSIVFFLLLSLFITACDSGAENTAEAQLSVDADITKNRAKAKNGQEKARAGRNKQYKEEKAAEALEEFLKNAAWEQELPKPARRDTIFTLLEDFYEEEAYSPAWNSYSFSTSSKDLLSRLENLHRDGLDTSDFSPASLRKEAMALFKGTGDLDYKALARLDIKLSAHYLALARQIGKGRIAPGKHTSNWHIHPEEVDKLGNLRKALAKGIDEALSGLEPDYRQYELLKEALHYYQEIADRGGWEAVSLKQTLSPGDSATAIRAIRKRLSLEFNLSDLGSAVYDEELQEVVQEFRYRYGLEPEEKDLNEELVQAMNIPVEERIRLINLNLERCRWLSEPMGDRYLLVNLPEYKLRVVEEGEPVLNMKVIIGKVMNSTPIFSDSMEYVEFSPYWNVPASIAREEIIPHAIKDPSYLQRRNYELVEYWHPDAAVISPQEVEWDSVSAEDFPYRVRQKPGPWNALGLVKFMFPNSKAIYLHDTPNQKLFQQAERGFSHGCIRVEEPDELAQYLLPQLSDRQIKRYMEDGNRKAISLEEKIPVYLVYFTAVVDSKGRLRFLEDIYGIDEQQGGALKTAG